MKRFYLPAYLLPRLRDLVFLLVFAAILPTGSALSLQLVQDGWRVLHQDDTAIILRRQ